MRGTLDCLFLAAATAAATACANGVTSEDAEGGIGVPIEASASDTTIPVNDSSTGSPDAGMAMSNPDASDPMDAATMTGMDATMTSFDAGSFDAGLVDGGIPDVMVPDVFIPPGTPTCNYFGSVGDFLQYAGECVIFSSISPSCGGGCQSGDCCGVLCTNSNTNQPGVCLPE
jgi:hypothetical protein